MKFCSCMKIFFAVTCKYLSQKPKHTPKNALRHKHSHTQHTPARHRTHNYVLKHGCRETQTYAHMQTHINPRTEVLKLMNMLKDRNMHLSFSMFISLSTSVRGCMCALTNVLVQCCTQTLSHTNARTYTHTHTHTHTQTHAHTHTHSYEPTYTHTRTPHAN